jgi:hypothetical protein
VRALTLALLLVFTAAAHPQGCDQCREAIGQTPPRTQRAYRRAITVLVIAGVAVFGGTLFALKRFR